MDHKLILHCSIGKWLYLTILYLNENIYRMENPSNDEYDPSNEREKLLSRIRENEELFRKTLEAIQKNERVRFLVRMPDDLMVVTHPIEDLVKERYGPQLSPHSSYGRFSVFDFVKGPGTYFGRELKSDEIVLEAGDVAALSGSEAVLKFQINNDNEVEFSAILQLGLH